MSMNEIGAELDISHAAVYRHFPSKYSLFRQETLRLSELGVRVVRLPEVARNWDPQRKFDFTVDAMIVPRSPTGAAVRCCDGSTATSTTTTGAFCWIRLPPPKPLCAIGSSRCDPNCPTRNAPSSPVH